MAAGRPHSDLENAFDRLHAISPNRYRRNREEISMIYEERRKWLIAHYFP
jgi:hypothetical protein